MHDHVITQGASKANDTSGGSIGTSVEARVSPATQEGVEDEIPLEQLLYLFAQQRCAIATAWASDPSLCSRSLPMSEEAKGSQRTRRRQKSKLQKEEATRKTYHDGNQRTHVGPDRHTQANLVDDRLELTTGVKSPLLSDVDKMHT